ncbi:glutamate synthase-related protein [Staphylococcus aureus]|nr:glutamate synthase-related protein [Staphylococcus aureus]WRN72915.1 glutamate synthase-related protein [Staphylococcus aureus]
MLFNPEFIFLLQHACKENDYAQFKAYSEAVNKNRTDHIRHLLEFKACTPIDIDQVEPVSDIVKRFNTGAMSYGSISAEAHETLAQAMNQLGGRVIVVKVAKMQNVMKYKLMEATK